MAIQITCSACNVRLSLGDDRAGDRFECPQCDAVIKVPYPEGQSAPPKPAPAPKPAAKAPPRPLEPDFNDEPRGPDKRVIAGIAAGVLAMLIVGAAVAMFAVRKPKEKDVAKADETPAPLVTKPVAPPPTPKKAPVFDVAPPPPPIDNTPPVVTPIVIDTPVMGDSGKQYVTSFLGSQAKGQRFCIVADNSGSMTGPNLANLKLQLLKTLDEMDPNAEFYIYFFNSVSEPMPHATWLKPGAAETAQVREWIKKTPARGGTNPVPSFESALKLNPKPDVVFLMTDGIFAPTVPNKVTELNGSPAKCVVNTILFEARGGFPAPKLPPGVPAPPMPVMPVPPKGAINGETQLKQIAEKNGGTFTRYTPP